MHPHILHIKTIIAEQELLKHNATLIVGLSGGPDSVYLLHMLNALRAEYNWNLIAAHVNHGWRQEADAEEQFCRELCEKLNIEFVSKHARDITVTKKAPGGSKEEQGRLLRRAFFEELAQQHNAQAIVLAHHADDQIETFFVRLIRGAGIEGLSAMHYKDGLYVRPLLSIFKKDILEYLDQNKLAYCVDASNDSLDFLRNRIRHQVIPALEATDSRFKQSCLKSIEHIQEADAYISAQATEAYNKLVSNGTLNYVQLMLLEPLLMHRVLITWLIEHNVTFVPSEAFFAELMRFFNNSKSNSHQVHTSWKLVKQKDWLSIQIV